MNKKAKQILILGGYGYANAGDEAQLNYTYNFLAKHYPEYELKVLSPDPAHTAKAHGFKAYDAPRVAFFDANKPGKPYKCDNLLKKIRFWLKATHIYTNALLIRHNYPTIFLDDEAKNLIHEIKNSSLIFFSGGGYLTGKTLSRLWDGIVFIKLASLFDTPVVLSGQTTGIWQNIFNKTLAGLAFRDVKLISLRDKQKSLLALKEIGVNPENIIPTHDDALFCEKEEDIEYLLKNSSMNDEDIQKGYIVMNFLYFGQQKRRILINKMKSVIDVIKAETDLNILLVPMHKTDEEALENYYYCVEEDNSRTFILNYDYDFKKIRGVISKAHYCITMRHHPIIFALGEGVPTISLAQNEYFVHKNSGALDLCGQQKFCINLNDEEFLDRFKTLFNELINNETAIKAQIAVKLDELKAKRNVFDEKLREYLP